MRRRRRRRRRPTAALLAAAGALAWAPSADAATNAIFTVLGTGFDGNFGDGGNAMEAAVQRPLAIEPLPDGGFLVGTSGRIRRVHPDGTVSTVAGTGIEGYSGDGGPATEAQVGQPWGIALEADGGLLIADAPNYRIRRIAPSGVITTVAGTGQSTPGPDGRPATETAIQPLDVEVLPGGGFVWVENFHDRVRMVGSDGIVRTVAGTGAAGFADGPAATAQFNEPLAVEVLPDGGLLVSDSGNDRVRLVAGGTVSTIAGSRTVTLADPDRFSGDGGPARRATLEAPWAIARAGDGTILVADTGNLRIRRISPAGRITTLAGSGQDGFAGDGGPATRASFRISIPAIVLAADGAC